MTETLLTAILALVGIVVLAISSVVMAIRAKGDRAITWSGFGVSFHISPCTDCPSHRKGGR